MTLWIAWSIVVSALIAVAGLAAERICAAYRVARRGVWMAAIVASTAGSVLMGLRTKDRPPTEASLAVSAELSSRSVNARPAPENADDALRLAPLEKTLIARADRWVGIVWAGMSVACVLGIGVSVARLRRRRQSWVETMTEAGPVLVAREDGPAVMGVFRPHIVMPAWALDGDDEMRRLMLRHEVEHLRVSDSRVLFGCAVLWALFPWNGALWFMSRRLRLAIEIDCDARVIRSIGAARPYGLMLLSVSERYTTSLPASALLIERGAQLEARITAMTTPSPKRPIAIGALCAAISGLVLATAAFTPRPIPFRSAAAAVAGPELLPGNPAPRYPDEMRANGVEGVVVATFVTDERGVPDSTSFSVLQATNEAFAASVRTVLPRLHYSGKSPVVFTCRFNITMPDRPRDAAYASPRYAGGVDTTRQIIITGVPPRR